MVIVIHLHTILQLKTETGTIRKLNMELTPGSLLAEVLGELNITVPVDELLLVVNGKIADPGCMLNDGDIVHLIPALSGG